MIGTVKNSESKFLDMQCRALRESRELEFTLPTPEEYNANEYDRSSWQRLLDSDPTSIIIQCKRQGTKCRDETYRIIVTYDRIFDSAKHGTDTLNERVEHTFEYG